jgi:hypothetical protein
MKLANDSNSKTTLKNFVLISGPLPICLGFSWVLQGFVNVQVTVQNPNTQWHTQSASVLFSKTPCITPPPFLFKLCYIHIFRDRWIYLKIKLKTHRFVYLLYSGPEKYSIPTAQYWQGEVDRKEQTLIHWEEYMLLLVVHRIYSEKGCQISYVNRYIRVGWFR